ncbi:hypothetical protein GYMLUDRAFT_264009 [Collybiopsis luxurians FD-317 M1]|uniref:Unplaced genomic scaffold GYMLUscaffold_56, whole genome shotgun sequence n=1 Tax=Collybiopsis luxurians FD-317 M1 TaxID=944289 RepID=A0A0D0AYE4_9AGAR|nr:hypothetical protein GYMLUDRAFT_264009 [Collybiopsis luxurians FD-317 M1]
MSSSLSGTRQSFENPRPTFRFPPNSGTYISFSLDIKQTLDLLRCDLDEKTEELIRSFPVRIYVAIVHEYPTVPIPDPIPEICLEPHMCFTVAPETSHPLNLPPINTNMPLPWEGCYHLSCLDAEVCLPQSHFNYANVIALDDKDWIRTYRYCWDDAALARANKRKAESGGITGTPTILSENAAQAPAHETIPKDEEFSEPSVTRYATEFGDEDDKVYDDPYEESGDDSDASSESIRWLSDDDGDDEDEDGGSHDVDEPIPLMNAILEALMPFDGYMPDSSIVPVIDLSLGLSGISSSFSTEQFYKNYDALKGLVKKCLDGSTIPSPSVAEEAQEKLSSTTEKDCVPVAPENGLLCSFCLP